MSLEILIPWNWPPPELQKVGRVLCCVACGFALAILGEWGHFKGRGSQIIEMNIFLWWCDKQDQKSQRVAT